MGAGGGVDGVELLVSANGSILQWCEAFADKATCSPGVLAQGIPSAKDLHLLKVPLRSSMKRIVGSESGDAVDVSELSLFSSLSRKKRQGSMIDRRYFKIHGWGTW